MTFPEDDNRIPAFNDCITGIFAKDRIHNYPYQTDQNCHFEQLQLNNENNLITERTYFIIYKPLSIILWVSNRNVSSFGLFSNYINTLLLNFNLPKISLNFIANTRARYQFDNASDYREFVFNFRENNENLLNISIPGNTTNDNISLFKRLQNDNSIKKVEVRIQFNEKIQNPNNKRNKKNMCRNIF
jgi:hypothetical protein